MSVGYSAEGDAQRLSVFQDGEAEGLCVVVFDLKMVACRGYVLHELTEARVVAGTTVTLHLECEGGTESPQHLSHLIFDLRFQHGS